MAVPEPRDRIGWLVGGALAVLVVAWVFVEFVGTFVLGLFLYYATRPAHRRLRHHRRLPGSVAAATALLTLGVPVVILVGYTLAVAAQELERLQGQIDLGPLAQWVDPYLDLSTVVQNPETLLENPDLVDAGRLLAEGVLDYVPVIGTAVINLFLALAIAFYLLRDGPRLSGWLRRTVGDDSETFDRYTGAVDEDLESVFFGNILNAFLIAIVGVVVYSALNVAAPGAGIPYPALLGVLCGAASLVPVVGMKLVYVPIAVGMFAQAVLTGDPLWFPAVFVVATVIFIDFIPDLLVRPYVSGRNLHVGLVMIAYIIGPLLFGWYGLFLGPLLLVLVYHFASVVVPELSATGPPARQTEPQERVQRGDTTVQDDDSPGRDPV